MRRHSRKNEDVVDNLGLDCSPDKEFPRVGENIYRRTLQADTDP